MPVQLATGSLKVAAFGPSPNPHRPWSWSTGSARRVRELCGGRPIQWWNLYEAEPAAWAAGDAAERAARWCNAHRNADVTLLLLGVKVCRAFGIEKPEWLEWYGRAMWRPMIAVPHPSGLNRWWNDADNERRARELLEAVAAGRLPLRQKNLEDETA